MPQRGVRHMSPQTGAGSFGGSTRNFQWDFYGISGGEIPEANGGWWSWDMGVSIGFLSLVKTSWCYYPNQRICHRGCRTLPCSECVKCAMLGVDQRPGAAHVLISPCPNVSPFPHLFMLKSSFWPSLQLMLAMFCIGFLHMFQYAPVCFPCFLIFLPCFPMFSGVHKWGNTPSHHPFLDGILPQIATIQLLGVAPWPWKPPCESMIFLGFSMINLFPWFSSFNPT